MQKINEMIKDKRDKLNKLKELRKCLKAGKDPATTGTAELRKFVQTAGVPKTADQCQ